eukprot:2435298-Pleurochrysis_carterae.AAC.2
MSSPSWREVKASVILSSMRDLRDPAQRRVQLNGQYGDFVPALVEGRLVRLGRLSLTAKR